MEIDLFRPVTMVTDGVKRVFRRIVNFYVNLAKSSVRLAAYCAKRIAILTLLFSVALWISILMYASFYSMYVPSASLIKPAYFKFRVCPSGKGMCSFPVANITLSTEKQVEVLGRGQRYKVILNIEVPDSAPNRDVGVFMVESKLYDRYAIYRQESSRSVTLRYQSDLLQMIQTIVFSPLYITGFAEQMQTLTVELFSEYWDDFYHPAMGILLEIQSRHLTFYSAEIQFHACYTGLRYYLFYYPLTCAVIGIIFNMIWVSCVFVVTWYRLGLDLLEGKVAPDGLAELGGEPPPSLPSGRQQAVEGSGRQAVGSSSGRQPSGSTGQPPSQSSSRGQQVVQRRTGTQQTLQRGATAENVHVLAMAAGGGRGEGDEGIHAFLHPPLQLSREEREERNGVQGARNISQPWGYIQPFVMASSATRRSSPETVGGSSDDTTSANGTTAQTSPSPGGVQDLRHRGILSASSS